MNNIYLTLVLATLATTGRVWLTIGLSIVTGWFLGYIAVKNRGFENVYISFIEVFESVPVISFFPVVLIFFIYRIGGYLGIEMAVDFLVFTAVVWNIWVGIYQAYKTIPENFLEVVENYRLGFLRKFTTLYIPYSMPRIAANLIPSFADAFFYITVSEVFSIGTSAYHVFGIGAILAELVSEGRYNLVLIGLGILAFDTTLTTFFLRRFATYTVERYGIDTEIKTYKRGKPRTRYNLRLTNTLTTVKKIASAFLPPKKYYDILAEEKERNYHLREIGYALAFLVVGIVSYGVFTTVKSISAHEWFSLLANTPSMLLGLAVDYARVAIIAIISFVIAIFVGYLLAAHSLAEKIVIPIIQAIAAFPAPAYFPLLFASTYVIVRGIFDPLTNEFYVLLLGFISTFYYVFYSFWLGVKNLPSEYWELMENLNLTFWQKLRKIILPATFPYIVAGISSTINSAWGGLAIGEYWPDIYNGYTLQVRTGYMKDIAVYTDSGNIAFAAWSSFLFGIIVVIYSILFTRKLMDLARKRYIAEEGIYAA
ncbi:MAG: ABC transporter permease subunit [Sulfolobaceae archaeon]|nr:ABC transporter permease subunit [Sulfolobaceae archaeon]